MKIAKSSTNKPVALSVRAYCFFKTCFLVVAEPRKAARRNILYFERSENVN